jgi:hypothetical protein
MRFALLLTALLLAGCGPRNIQDCLADASKLPTNMGVQLAIGQCRLKFPPPPNPFEQFDAQPPETPVDTLHLGRWVSGLSALTIIAFVGWRYWRKN